jgi:hypothetical protein
LVWNRPRFVKDPDSGKRQARPNLASEWITEEVPVLRIIDEDLWTRVKQRQGAIREDTLTVRAEDPAVQRLVAFAQLLSFKFREAALGLDRHQLLGHDLLQPFALHPFRQMDRAGRERRTLRAFLLGRPFQSQEAVGLGLEGRNRHGPEPRTAPEAFAVSLVDT